MLSQTMTEGISSVMSSKAVSLSQFLQLLVPLSDGTGNGPRALVVRRRLSEIRLIQLLSLEQVGYDTQCGPITLCRIGRNQYRPIPPCFALA